MILDTSLETGIRMLCQTGLLEKLEMGLYQPFFDECVRYLTEKGRISPIDEETKKRLWKNVDIQARYGVIREDEYLVKRWGFLLVPQAPPQAIIDVLSEYAGYDEEFEEAMTMRLVSDERYKAEVYFDELTNTLLDTNKWDDIKHFARIPPSRRPVIIVEDLEEPSFPTPPHIYG